jgi:hypothetical protein
MVFNLAISSNKSIVVHKSRLSNNRLDNQVDIGYIG